VKLSIFIFVVLYVLTVNIYLKGLKIMHNLTQNEELILLSILKLKDDAYGVPIRRNVMQITEKTLHYGSLYNTLDHMVKKGLVITKRSEPLARKGGRSRVMYFLTPEGKKALQAAREYHKSVLNSIPDVAI